MIPYFLSECVCISSAVLVFLVVSCVSEPLTIFHPCGQYRFILFCSNFFCARNRFYTSSAGKYGMRGGANVAEREARFALYLNAVDRLSVPPLPNGNIKGWIFFAFARGADTSAIKRRRLANPTLLARRVAGGQRRLPSKGRVLRCPILLLLAHSV